MGHTRSPDCRATRAAVPPSGHHLCRTGDPQRHDANLHGPHCALGGPVPDNTRGCIFIAIPFYRFKRHPAGYLRGLSVRLSSGGMCGICYCELRESRRAGVWCGVIDLRSICPIDSAGARQDPRCGTEAAGLVVYHPCKLLHGPLPWAVRLTRSRLHSSLATSPSHCTRRA